MVKKLTLDEFIQSSALFYDDPSEFVTESRKGLIESRYFSGYSIYDMVKILLNHKGFFIIEDTSYNNFSYNDYNIYFFSENFNKTTMIIYDPIVNIERNGYKFTITYYRNKQLTISLMKDTKNGQKAKISYENNL